MFTYEVDLTSIEKRALERITRNVLDQDLKNNKRPPAWKQDETDKITLEDVADLAEILRRGVFKEHAD